jgi:hypothetical protein
MTSGYQPISHIFPKFCKASEVPGEVAPNARFGCAP